MKILTVLRGRESLAARHPRLAYFVGSEGTRSALPLALWASALAEVAAGMLPGRALWLVAAVLALIAVYRLLVAAYHAAFCPCVLEFEDEDLALAPEDKEVY